VVPVAGFTPANMFLCAVAPPAEKTGATRDDMFLCAALSSLATLAAISFRSVHFRFGYNIAKQIK
jgi:hypothetical protein